MCKHYQQQGYQGKWDCNKAQYTSNDYGTFKAGSSGCIHDSKGDYFEQIDSDTVEKYSKEIKELWRSNSEKDDTIRTLKNRLVSI